MKSLHIVQIGSDDSVFREGIGSEFAQRQMKLGELLEQQYPSGLITFVIFTTKSSVTAITARNVTFLPLHVNLRGHSKFRAWHLLFLKLAELDKQQGIDVLSTQTIHDEAWSALAFAQINRRPIVGQIHYDLFSPHVDLVRGATVSNRIRYSATLSLMRYFSAIRVVGHSIAREIVSRHLHRDVHTIPVSMSMVNMADPQQCSRDPNSVLYVGRLVHEKNLFGWLDVAQRVSYTLPSAKFHLVGEGEQRKALETEVQRRGMTDRVTFHGFVPYELLPQFYQSSSVFLLTSFYEGFGRVIVEALSNRLPVVVPRITGAEDIVVNGLSGYVHTQGDVSGMADSVTRLLRDQTNAKFMGEWGKAYVQKFYDERSLQEKWLGLLVKSIH